MGGEDEAPSPARPRPPPLMSQTPSEEELTVGPQTPQSSITEVSTATGETGHVWHNSGQSVCHKSVIWMDKMMRWVEMLYESEHVDGMVATMISTTSAEKALTELMTVARRSFSLPEGVLVQHCWSLYLILSKVEQLNRGIMEKGGREGDQQIWTKTCMEVDATHTRQRVAALDKHFRDKMEDELGKFKKDLQGFREAIRTQRGKASCVSVSKNRRDALLAALERYNHLPESELSTMDTTLSARHELKGYREALFKINEEVEALLEVMTKFKRACKNFERTGVPVLTEVGLEEVWQGILAQLTVRPLPEVTKETLNALKALKDLKTSEKQRQQLQTKRLLKDMLSDLCPSLSPASWSATLGSSEQSIVQAAIQNSRNSDDRLSLEPIAEDTALWIQNAVLNVIERREPDFQESTASMDEIFVEKRRGGSGERFNGQQRSGRSEQRATSFGGASARGGNAGVQAQMDLQTKWHLPPHPHHQQQPQQQQQRAVHDSNSSGNQPRHEGSSRLTRPIVSCYDRTTSAAHRHSAPAKENDLRRANMGAAVRVKPTALRSGGPASSAFTKVAASPGRSKMNTSANYTMGTPSRAERRPATAMTNTQSAATPRRFS